MSLEQSIKDAFKGVNYPGYSRDIGSFGLVKKVAAANGSASIGLELSAHNPEIAAQLKARVEAAATSVDGIDRAMVQIKMPPAGQARAPRAAACRIIQQTNEKQHQTDPRTAHVRAEESTQANAPDYSYRSPMQLVAPP